MNKRHQLIGALFLLSAGASMLHFRIHPPMAVPPELAAAGKTGPKVLTPTYLTATILCLVDLILVTAMFAARKTAAAAYLINGMLCILGSIFMTHFAVSNLIRNNVPLISWPLQSTLPDIAILGGDFLIGMILYNSYRDERLMVISPNRPQDFKKATE